MYNEITVEAGCEEILYLINRYEDDLRYLLQIACAQATGYLPQQFTFSSQLKSMDTSEGGVHVLVTIDATTGNAYLLSQQVRQWILWAWFLFTFNEDHTQFRKAIPFEYLSVSVKVIPGSALYKAMDLLPGIRFSIP